MKAQHGQGAISAAIFFLGGGGSGGSGGNDGSSERDVGVSERRWKEEIPHHVPWSKERDLHLLHPLPANHARRVPKEHHLEVVRLAKQSTSHHRNVVHRLDGALWEVEKGHHFAHKRIETVAVLGLENKDNPVCVVEAAHPLGVVRVSGEQLVAQPRISNVKANISDINASLDSVVH